MSAETMQDLQTNTLIGQTAQRGNAWHRRDDLRRLPDGTMLEDNHYPGFIPVADVTRRLFNWQPKTVTVAYLEPCDVADAQFITAAGQAVRIIESQSERFGLLRDDNDYDLGVFKSAKHHPYQKTLIQDAERLTGTILGVSSAGLLAKGGRAWVEFSLPETLHDDKSGFDYRPNIVKADSMDGSMSIVTARTINATVCDNTLSCNLLEAKASGVLFKRKHTAGNFDLQDERDALGILEETDTAFLSELHQLIAQDVTARQLDKVMDILMPMPAEGTPNTKRTNQRDRWMSLYTSDPMCAPWKGTAFGVVQTDNTYQHHHATVAKTVSRSERNTWRAIQGKQRESDQRVVAALEAVLA